MVKTMEIRKEWAMPNGATFTIKPIKKLLSRYVGGGKGWIDPFAGNNSPAEFTNDLNINTTAKEHKLALDFVKEQERSFIGCLFDPPYSGRQVSELYRQIKKVVHTDDTNAYFYSAVKDELSKRIVANGVAICFGWNSNGFGKKRGFTQEEILLVAHGGAHNDTICVVERKIQQTLNDDAPFPPTDKSVGIHGE